MKKQQSGTEISNIGAGQLMGSEELLAAVFPNESTRPSVRWLRRQQQLRALPFKKIGKLVFWDAGEVRRVIDMRMTVPAK
jgi:hypothetical protein